MSKKPVSLARVLLWSSLGIENVLVITLVWLRTDIDYFSPFGFEYPPEQKAELLSALTSLRWATIIPWMILANGLGIAVRAYLLWRSERSKLYSTLIWGSAIVAVVGYFAADYLMMSRRFDAYPRIFQAQVLSTSNSCMGADILTQWGSEGCQFTVDNAQRTDSRSRQVSAVTALGYLSCPQANEVLWKLLEDREVDYYVRVQAASALDWRDPKGNKDKLTKLMLALQGTGTGMGDDSLARNIKTWLEYNENARKAPGELYKILFPSACWRIELDEGEKYMSNEVKQSRQDK